MSGESGGHRLRLSMLNDQLTCKLCRGYFIDATTIIECLHSFCRSCIVKYLEKNKYCPICEVQVHKSKPLLNIRPDHTLQDIVYKLVPACYQNEMRCRRDFYAKNPEALRSTTSPEARGEPVESHIYSPDESLSLSLEYYTPIDQPAIGELGVDDAKETSGVRKHQQQDQKDQQLQQKPRYLRCPAAVMVFHLQKLIRAKYGLSEAHRVDVMYKEETLCDSYTLMDVMYIYHWRRKVPLHLSYRIFESSPKRLKLAEDNENFKQSLTNAGISPVDPRGESQNQQQQQQQQQQQGVPGAKREWREVQLKISETGVISVTDITSPDSKKNVKTDKKVASAPSCGSASASGDTTEAEPQKLADDGKIADSVNKSDKTRQETKTPGQLAVAVDQPKTREKKIAETSGKNAIKSETSKMSSESATTNLTKSIAGTSENLSEQPRESSHQSRESNNNERNTVTRETRSRTDLRSSNIQETEQAVIKGISGATESRRSKVSTGETVSVAEKSRTTSPKTAGNSEKLETSSILMTDEEKLENRLHVGSTNKNLVNSNASDPPTNSSHEDIPTGNKKAAKIHETKNSQQQSSAGSKIDALSAKLQFQPKIGEVNNTYSKKAPKEKRTILEKVLKKSSTQASSSSISPSSASTSPSPSSSSSSSSSSAAASSASSSFSSACCSSTESTLTVRAIGKHSGESLKTRSSTASLTVGKSIRIESNPSVSITSSTGNQTSQKLNCLGGGTTITSTHSSTATPSVSVSVTTMQKTTDRGENTAGNRRGSSTNVETNATPEQQPKQQQNSGGELKNTSKSSYRRENQSMTVPSSESLASIGLNVSTSMQSSTSTFPYTVQDLVNSGILKNSPGATKVSGLTIQKTLGISHQQQSSLSNSSGCAGSLSQACSSAGTSFNLHTPSMTIYSISTPPKNSASGNLGGSSLYPNASTQITNCLGSGSKSAANITVGKSSGNSNVEITSVYSVPPCPDAIPISLMKPTVRKHEVIAKATNVNDICAKIGTTGGSKINDICAKIGENSKEKNKAEARSRPEIPDLLKIAKKPLQSSSATLSSEVIGPKHIPNIPNVPIYTPSNSLAGESKVSYTKETMSSGSKTTGCLTSASQSGLQVTKTGSGGGAIGGAKKQSQSIGYTTLRHPPKSWNPTLSKNNYVALKNQAKESSQSSSALMAQQQQQQETVGNVKSIGVKRIDSAKRRNTPRFLGNPASGVKPLYGVTEGKGGGVGVESREPTTAGGVASGKNSGLSMTKIDPKTLSPIVSSSNSPIVSPPPYSPSARGTCYQTFSREICARTGSGGSPITSRNSPVNMLSTNPFIPSPTPNTHPRLFYPHYPPPFPESPKLSNPLIRSPIGIPPPSAYHSSLPPSINKFLQRTSYMPQTTGVYSQQQISQPPTVQRIPASSSSSSSPKSPKKSNSPGASFCVTKTETQTSTGGATGSPNLEGKNAVLLAKAVQDSNVFNLSKTGSSHQPITAEVETSENPDKESGQLTQGKRESFGKSRESEKQRRASGETERGARQRDDDNERMQLSSGKKGHNEERDNNSGLHNTAEKDKSVEESTKDARQVDNNKKDSEKIGTKVNGDLSNDNNSASDAKQQESFLRNEGKDLRCLDNAKTNLSREAKESESGKPILTTQGNNNPNLEKNQASKDCSEKKVEEQIGKSAEQIQGKNNKTTNAESQRNKAES